VSDLGRLSERPHRVLRSLGGAQWTALRLTRPGAWVASLVLLLVAGGLLAGNPAVVLLAIPPALGIGLSYMAAMAAAGAARHGGLRAVARAADSVGKVHVAGRPLEVEVVVSSRLGRSLRVTAERVVMSTGLRQSSPSSPRPDFTDSSPAQREITAVCAGVHRIFGVHLRLASGAGLFAMELYLPCPLELRALPRSALLANRVPLSSTRLSTRTAEGAVASARAGSGIELRELRDLVAGDSFRSIDWKASARFAKLVVRDRESDVTLSAVLIVDASPSMRSGAPGERPLDRALDAAFSFARASLAARDRVGVICVDGTTLQEVKPGTRHATLVRVTDLLLTAASVLDVAPLDEDDPDLARRLSSFARHHHHGVARPVLDPLQTGALDALEAPPVPRQLMSWLVARGASQAEVAMSRALRQGSREPSWPELGPSLRVAADAVGLELRHRGSLPSPERQAGLLDAVNRVLREPGGPHTAVIFSDFADLEPVEPLARSVRLLRHHGHQVVLWVLSVSDDPLPADLESDVPGALRTLLRTELSHEQAAAIRALSVAGAVVAKAPRPRGRALDTAAAVGQSNALPG
jgi:uncharacterized protein (DUF58 family)